MYRRLSSVVTLALVALLAQATPAFANSYHARITQYVAERPAQARIVQMALTRAGWGYDSAYERNRMAQAIMVSAGESGMNPLNDRNKSCSGLFQILKGKSMYGRWTAEELSNPATLEHYTLSETPWRFGTIKKYQNGTYLGVGDGWYVKAGFSGHHPSHWAWGKVKLYTNSTYMGDGPGWYRAPEVTYYAPKAGEYKIFNPVFNAEVALRMHTSRGWQPWTVARKLGYR